MITKLVFLLTEAGWTHTEHPQLGQELAATIKIGWDHYAVSSTQLHGATWTHTIHFCDESAKTNNA